MRRSFRLAPPGAVVLLVLAALAGAFAAPAAAAPAACLVRTTEAMDVALVVDRSGSMSGARLSAAKDAGKAILDGLLTTDRSSLVSFNAAARVDRSPTSSHAATRAALDGLSASGTADLAAAIDLAHATYAANPRAGTPAPRWHMVLITDSTSESTAALLQAQQAKDAGFQIHVIGIGTAVDAGLLGSIATRPASHYFHAAEASQVVPHAHTILQRMTARDASAPTISLSSPDGQRHTGALDVSGSASDDCQVAAVDVVTDPDVGWSIRSTGGAFSASFDCADMPRGAYTVRATVTDWVGRQAVQEEEFGCVHPGGQATALGLWIGNDQPANIEYRTVGVHHTAAGASRSVTTDTIEQVPLTAPYSLQVQALGVEDEAELALASLPSADPTSKAVATTRIAQLRVTLLEGSDPVASVEAHGLSQHAEVARTFAASVGSNDSGIIQTVMRADRVIVSVAGETVLDESGVSCSDAACSVTVPLPTGGSIRLFERPVERTDSTSTPAGLPLVFAGNLVHVHAMHGAGAVEVIAGSLIVHVGDPGSRHFQQRIVLLQDDAGTGADAPSTTTDAPVLEPGPGQTYRGALPTGDESDVFRLRFEPAQTGSEPPGRRLLLALDPVHRATVTGGSIEGEGTDVGDWDAEAPEADLSDAPSHVMRLIDPTGAVREHGDLLPGSGTPNRIEFNLDVPGDWYVRVERYNSAAIAANYTLAASMTPIEFLPEDDAGSGGDAPAACGAALAPRLATGTYQGTTRWTERHDVYRVDVAAGQRLAATLKPGLTADGVDMSLTLYGPGCVLLQFSDINGITSGAKGTPEAVEALAALPGTYHLQVTRVAGEGVYSLAVAVT